MHIRPQCYLSHRSALQFHTLIDDPATTTIYVNDEQSPKRRSTSMLQQSAIDAAFRRPARVSNNVVMLGETQVYQLSGMHTGKLGVIPHVIPGIPIPVRVTSIERTLIDCTVRPSYAGGVASVLQAYRRAADRVDVQKLFKMLQNINYVYPYHQSIGFYLEHSRSYSLAANAIFQQTPRDYDFYLDNEITNPAYSAVWRIMYPQHLELPSMR